MQSSPLPFCVSLGKKGKKGKNKKEQKQKRTKTRPPCHTDHSRHNPRDFNFGKALMCPFTLTLRSRITKSQHCSITIYHQTNQHWALTITYWEACATRTTCPSLSIPNPSLSFHTPRADIPAKFKNNILITRKDANLLNR